MSNYIVQRKMADPVVDCKDPSMASQSDLRDTQISSILRRYNATGVLPVVNRPVLVGNELPSDFTEACNNFTMENAKNEYRTGENPVGPESGPADDSVSVHTPESEDSGARSESGEIRGEMNK